MASSTMTLKLACLVLLCLAVSAHVAQAITCGQVASDVAPCISYISGKGPLTSGCCNGIKNLIGLAKTTADRQTTCNCLKSGAGNISGINYGTVAGLPGKCGVNIPYKLSLSTDCSKVK